MKNKTIKKILFAVFAVAICVAAYFAADLAFFQYDDPLARAALTVENDDNNLSFTYDNDAITLHGAEDSTVYALTVDGIKTVEGAYTESLPSDFLGSFAAVRIDSSNDDGDGITEREIYIAKTDMEYTQGYTTSANVFLSDEIPFEVAYADRDLMTGGGALNIGLRKAFEDELMRDIFVANHPQFNGAIGAALLASERG